MELKEFFFFFNMAIKVKWEVILTEELFLKCFF